MMFSISNPLTAIVATYYTDELIMYCNNTKLEAEGVTYGEVKYTGGEASIIKINNWGTIEKTTIARHKKGLCYGLYWQKTLGYRINSLCCRSEWRHSCNGKINFYGIYQQL